MLKLITAALRRPITVMVSVIFILLFAFLSLQKIPIDIFPKLNIPTIYISQPYGGLSAQQMEGFITSRYEYYAQYVTGLKSVESKSIQGIALIKLQFYEGTDMSQALSEVVASSTRARANMPPGTLPPFITRFDVGSVPVGQLVFSSETKTLSEIQDEALYKVRPMFTALPGVSAPPPLGGNQRTIVVHADPERLSSYHLTPDDLVTAIVKNNFITPSGNIRIGNLNLITPQNTVMKDFGELQTMPVTLGNNPVYLHDVATVENGADLTTGYALINGHRSVYIPVTKRSDASTWQVIKALKKNLPKMQAAVPEDIKVSFEFDQSSYVINSLKNLIFEGLLGALLTGLMVLLFLRNKRSALIVVITIPLAIFCSVICLYLLGQTMNIMTLGGFALAVGILVDEATVTIENIHHHLESGKPKANAIIDASREIAVPKLLILLCLLAVFVPALFMSGVPGSMFLPMSLAVGFAMIASFLLSQTFVPVLSNYLLKDDSRLEESQRWLTMKENFQKAISHFYEKRNFVIPFYFILVTMLCFLSYHFIGKEIFPRVDAGQIQLRMRLPAGTRIERTEEVTKKVLSLIDSLSNHEIEISSAFVGTQPSSFPNNTIHLWTSGSHESVMKIRFKKTNINLEQLKESLRDEVNKQIPSMRIFFEPADLVDVIMSQGTNAQLEIVVQGKSLSQSQQVAEKIKLSLTNIKSLRDVQFSSPLTYPALEINYDRERAALLNLYTDKIARSVTEATSSSRFTQQVWWLDTKSGTSYQIQVELPPSQMNSTEELDQVPIANDGNNITYLRDVATWKTSTVVGEYDRLNQQRYLSIIANLHNQDLGKAVSRVEKTIEEMSISDGTKVALKGQSEILDDTMYELSIGLLIAIIVIFLILTMHFQSFITSLISLSTVPAVIAGSLMLLWATSNTLNIQSFLGCIMAIGVSISNSILLVTNAEHLRLKGGTINFGNHAAKNRFRPIIMTSLAMIAGMIPLALGLGEGVKQVAPLGVAVIGGLLLSTITTLFIIPGIYQSIVGTKKYKSDSLDPEDSESRYFNP
jgi:multidrug efflux pump subunit AcrB